jgi:phage tail sheath protein FI
MAFQLSPGVNVSEVDLTTVVPSVSTTVGGFAGNFNWGPVNEIVTINNEVQLVDRFGKPDANTFTSFFTAANFLSYGSDLRLVRSTGSSSNNATTTFNTGIRIDNRTDYEQNHSSGSTSIVFASKYPGSLGNSLKVSMCDANTLLSSTWSYANEFSSQAANSSFATAKGVSRDELHIVVIDTTGAISGRANTIVEKFGFVSKASDAKNTDGSSNYYKDVLNSRSKYVWWLGHPTEGTNWGQTTTQILQDETDPGEYRYDLLVSTDYSFSNGADDSPNDAEIQVSYNLFNNSDSNDVSLLMAGATVGDSTPDHLINIAEERKDCLVFISPELDDVLNVSGGETTNIITLRNLIQSSSFAVMDSGWKYQYDRYNDVYRWVPLNGDIAGLCARSDLERDPWFSPAGFNRGQIKNVVKLAWNPTKAERDTLYKSGVNPVVTFPGEGTILYGDKTLLSRPSAFDRINVRRLFIVLEKAIARASRSSLFEFNDEFTRSQFVSLVEPFLRDVQGRRGIYDFRVVCDTTNNTPEVIDRNEFVGDIYIKPARSINFIQLNFVAVRTGVSFNEIVGQF